MRKYRLLRTIFNLRWSLNIFSLLEFGRNRGTSGKREEPTSQAREGHRGIVKFQQEEKGTLTVTDQDPLLWSANFDSLTIDEPVRQIRRTSRDFVILFRSVGFFK
jgi:hypothetical protein